MRGMRRMRASTQILSRILAVGLLCAGAPSARASSQLPQLPRRNISDSNLGIDLKNKEITDAHEGGANCVSDAKAKTSSSAGGNCLPQHDAFRRAGEAASYLGHYYTNFTPFAYEMRDMKEDERKNYYDSIRECVADSPKCTKEGRATVLKAMVQYNFGKQIKSMVLENNTRSENMKSIDLGAKGWRELGARAPKVLTHNGRLRTGTTLKNTFRLNPYKSIAGDTSALSDGQRAILGNNFMNEYRNFIDEYSSTTGQRGPKSRWHYVHARTSAVPGGAGTSKIVADGANRDPLIGKNTIDHNRLDADARSQSTRGASEIVKNFKDSLHRQTVERKVKINGKVVTRETEWSKTDPSDILAVDVGFGVIVQEDPENPGKLLTNKEVAQGIVLKINNAIHQKEKEVSRKKIEARKPSSSGAPAKELPPESIWVDVERFDKFLDAIWPAEIAKPAK